MADLLKLHEVKQRLFLINEDKYDLLLMSLISDVSSILETYCGRHFTAADYTEYQDGNLNDEILTDEWPINSVTSIYDDPDRTFSSSSLVNADDYVFYPDEGIIRLLISGTIVGRNFQTVFSIGHRNVKIVYNAGYTTIPGDLKMIASEIITKKFKSYTDRRVGMTNVSSNGENMSFAINDILPDHKLILDMKYRERGTG
jgi:hypothetical protein